MRVLMFGWEFPPHITGGLGTACYGLTTAMAQKDCEVIFVVPKAYGDEDQKYIKIKNASDVALEQEMTHDETFSEHLKFIYINSNLIPYVTPEEWQIFREETLSGHRTYKTTLWNGKYNFKGGYGPSLMEEVARYAVIAGQIAKELEGQFDVIHAHDWLTYYAGIAAKRVSGKPLVVHIHATEYDRTGENVNTIVYAMEKEGMMVADKVCAVSNLTRNIVIEKYGIDENKVVTIHNGVKFKKTPQTEVVEKNVEDKIVTFLGRITYQKGPDYFVEAAAKVLKKMDNVRFVMAGSGDMLNHVVRHVAKLGIADRFHFTGFLKGDDVKKMFAMSDLYIMPSVSEPFGISPLEAMRSNVPVIISKQSGVAEVLDNAIKVDYWDVDALADAIYSVLKYPALHKTMQERGGEEVNAITWDNAAEKLINVYNSLI